MLELPEKFRKNIINRYNEKGIEWLSNLDNVVNKYTNKFELKDVELIKDLSMNLVIFANSKKYGDVVLKICAPGKTACTEIKVMKKFNISNMVKCYYSNLKDRVLILERIVPGYSLNNVKEQNDRIKIFCKVLKNYSIPDNNKKEFPSYEEKLKNTLEYFYSNKIEYSEYNDIIYLVEEMKNLYSEVQKMNLNKYILHNDLNHKNILKSENGWKVIDPHGVVGEKLFETAQFIRGEITINKANVKEINKIASLISKELGKDRILILKFLYIVTVEKIVWFIKVKDNKEVISNNIDIANEVLKLVKENE